MTMRGFKPSSNFMGTASAFSLKRPGPLNMKLNAQELEKIADLTLDCYNQNAEDFWEGTRHHDVSQNIAAMLQHIEGERPFAILDFGCGPGVTLKSSPNSATSQ